MTTQAAPVGPLDRFELATDPGEVTALAPEWRALAERRGNAFLTPEWLLAWLRHCGRGWKPHVPVARTPDGIIRGLLPLVAAETNGGRELRVCPIGDRFHPVAAASDEEAVAREAAHALAPAGGLRSLLLENVDAEGGWWRALAKASPTPLATVERGEATLPFLELAGIGWDEYLAGRSRQLRSQLGRKLRSLRREHDVRFRRTLRLEEVPADLLTLFRLHDERWAQRPESSSLADPDVRAFHFEFATAAFERDWLRLFVMEVDGAPIAALYGWSIGGRWSYYQAGFDPAWSRYSPGFLLLGETIRAAIEEGASEYDLLRGDEAFKRRFATSSRTARTVLLAPRGHQAHINAAAAARLRRAWRTLPSRPRARARRLASRLGVRLTT
jgi:CelD/BcsL family acetyltransferase involved in cellulose biosynthesis